MGSHSSAYIHCMHVIRRRFSLFFSIDTLIVAKFEEQSKESILATISKRDAHIKLVLYMHQSINRW
jgi:hypothetical protein